ncbi:MAG TPA: HEAT repeat domain-containing protein [Smithella sp.]|nr:HEAT repeat domain-containing protein [Smithella sp.]
MNIRDNDNKETDKFLSIKQSDDIKKLFVQMVLTSKNVSLYPEGHSISSNSIKQFHEALDAHIRKYGDIRFEFERDRVLCQKIEVQTEPPEEGSLTFTLFRDGIRWLEFTEGIDLEEIRELLSIVQKYSVLTKEPEGDIVTAFWEARFDHVFYQADDFVSEHTVDKLDQSLRSDTMPAVDEAGAGDSAPEETAAFDKTVTDDVSTGGPDFDQDSFLLTTSEQIALQEMISREEMLPATAHLNMLLDMLLQHKEEKDFNVILEVISEEFDGSIRRRDFEAAVIILNGLRKIMDSGRLNCPQAGPLIETFYNNISSDTRCLKPLKEAWSSFNFRQIEFLGQVFKHLHPQALDTLMQLLLSGQPSQLEQMTQDTIIVLIQQDMNSLDPLITTADEKTAEKLVFFLSKLDADISLNHLMKLARHFSSSVRRLAIKTIVQSGSNQAAKVFEFIDDPDESVRRVVLMHMGRTRNNLAEDFLLQYIQSRKPGTIGIEHIMECFAALGKCGSARSIPLLSQILLQRKWTGGFRKSAYREGAAQALMALKIPEARQVIEKAGHSLNPALRRIARKAGKELFQKNKKGR